MSVVAHTVSYKQAVERKRQADCKALIEKMKELLVLKGYALPGELTSQELTLFKVVHTITGENLLPKFEEKFLKKNVECKMSRQERGELKKEREQYRRQKIEASINLLEEFIFAKGLTGGRNLHLTRVRTLQLTLDYLQTLEIFPSPPITPQLLSFSIERLLAPEDKNTEYLKSLNRIFTIYSAYISSQSPSL
ncbi:Protein CBG21739 [Caenorhabditis briggsae]|uniref:BHLH domain-containing protein n=2 Tax=Caenorhabditis briggsae TaxID=6238 RepID=A0AAE9A7L4_CAEBR|nr:Protein CBG21739 [Caenorhabditis briggsae]ULT94048.1 hypothetical protein L3Y34_003497 [Caenorhabditis briggsae]UMM27292.1 hypothetical protein L5515_010650 [Caenorhabditis briggsae]CAP38432.1 Protein CBG21739 [Caenorhabditis briggsae]